MCYLLKCKIILHVNSEVVARFETMILVSLQLKPLKVKLWQGYIIIKNERMSYWNRLPKGTESSDDAASQHAKCFDLQYSYF